MKTSNHLRTGLSGRHVSGIIGGLTALLLSVFFMTGCPQITDDPSPSFIAVTDIINLPGSVEAGVEFNLSGAAVMPENATNKAITWSVTDAGGTGVTSVAGGKATPTAAGYLKIKATIANGRTAGSSAQVGISFTLDFTIEVTPAKPAFVKVSGISGVPGKVVMGTEINLNNTGVTPFNANYKTIQWSISDAGTTGASALADNKTTPTAKGELKLTAVIENGAGEGYNYTANFTVTVITPEEFNAVTDISGVPAEAEAGITLDLSGAVVAPANADNKTIVWSVIESGGTGVNVFDNNKATPSAAGTLKIRASVANGKVDGTAFVKDFEIAVKPAFVAVTGIGGVEAKVATGVVIDLTTATALPETATNKAITWTLVDAGTTGVTVEDLADDYKITPTATGILKLKASVANGSDDRKTAYVEDIEIEVVAALVPVTGLKGTVPSTGKVGTEINLTGIKVEPADATSQNIVWTVIDDGGTGVTTEDLKDSKATPSAAGTLKIKATVANGISPSQDYVSGEYTITVIIEEVTGVTGVPANFMTGTVLNLNNAAVTPDTATHKGIAWSLVDAGATGVTAAQVASGEFTPASQGNLTVRATVANGKISGDYTTDITIIITNTGAFVPVSNITLNLPSGIHHATREIDLTNAKAGVMKPGTSTVDYTLDPTYTNILWTLESADTTGVTEQDLEDRRITPTAAGALVLRATIKNGKSNGTEDYTRLFNLTIYFYPVTGITLPEILPPDEEIDLNTVAVIYPDVISSQSPVVWTVREAMSGVSAGVVVDGKVTPTAAGKLKLKAEIANGTGWEVPYIRDDLEISIEEESTVLLYKGTEAPENLIESAIENLDDALRTINDEAVTGDKFVVVVKAKQTITPYVFPTAAGKKNIEITLRGEGKEQIIEWDANKTTAGAAGLFTLNNTSTLILGSNITVDGKGRTTVKYSGTGSNSISLISIGSTGGTLRMKTGSKITGAATTNAINTIANSAADSTITKYVYLEGGEISVNKGGVSINKGAVFEMSAGAIKNNTGTGLSLNYNSVGSASMSGGEISENGGYPISFSENSGFTMSGGFITNNNGGINIITNRFFVMTGGVIEGNTKSPSSHPGLTAGRYGKIFLNGDVTIKDPVYIWGNASNEIGEIFLGPNFNPIPNITISICAANAEYFANVWNGKQVIFKGGTQGNETTIGQQDWDNKWKNKFQAGAAYNNNTTISETYIKGGGHVEITRNTEDGYVYAEWVAD
jgi:hypothetical protein